MPLFQNESSCKTFLMKIPVSFNDFNCMNMDMMNGILVLTQRQLGNSNLLDSELKTDLYEKITLFS